MGVVGLVLFDLVGSLGFDVGTLCFGIRRFGLLRWFVGWLFFLASGFDDIIYVAEYSAVSMCELMYVCMDIASR